MPTDVHLPESVLGVHVALRGKQVLKSVCIELRNPEIVTDNRHRGGESVDRHLPGNNRERRPNGVNSVERHPANNQNEDEADDPQDSPQHTHEPTVGTSGPPR